MDRNEQLREVMRQLYKKSSQDQIKWRRVGEAYEIALPASSIAVRFFSPEFGPDVYLGVLMNSRGEEVLRLEAEEGGKDWELLRQLYDDATRVVSGWDTALADAMKALQGDNVLGGEQRAKVVSELTDDDIPF